MNRKQKKMLVRIVVSAALLLAALLLPLPLWARCVLYAASYIVVGWDILRKAALGIGNRQMFDENFLMAVATLGAIALALYEGSGDFTEAVAVMLFYQIGELFQNIAVGRSRRSISALMDIRPDYANIEDGGALVQVDPEEVAVGSVIVVQPGERIPLDGFIVEGASTVSTAALTGESLPRDVQAGDEVVSGCINLTGVLRVQTTRAYGDSTVARILELVENSSSRKSRSENFISRFARVYTPAVVFGALALALLPPLVRLAFGMDALWGAWCYRALTFLVISCPCALVISIPLSFFAGIGGASREGILVKGSNYLETLSQVKTVVFDKTGTITRGVFEVSGIHHSELPDEQLIEYAALAECASSHPISQSLRRCYGREPDRSRVRDIEERSGRGVLATVDGVRVAAGNDKLMTELGVPFTPCRSAGTVIHIALDGEYAGHILISDVEKDDVREALTALRAAGVTKTVMLIGDAESAARQVAERVGIDEYHSGLLPADKVALVEQMLEAPGRSGKLAFVGDGINDAPVLTRADLGIAMGALGSDAAIEAADVVLMDDDPMKISRAIAIARKCLRIVYENIVFALAVKFGCLLLGALGLAGMWAAIFADVGVMVLAVLNAMRALNTKKL
ncbi:MAG: cadmium-translocating P-type ATPase [Oscillospiraceae bacterium]|nr:cadmium-translocating P-type ATPase [Oscillospiraceae bacterium]